MTTAPEIGPTEELLTEHGLLNRCLLIYKAALGRPRRSFPCPQVSTAAAVVRTVIHDHHEEMEESYVFPRLIKHDQHAATCQILLDQHHAGKRCTDRILSICAGKTIGPVTASVVTESMRDFITMYEPHEAEEDTVIFPAFRDLLTEKDFYTIATEMHEKEAALLGPDAFGECLRAVQEAEQELGIADLKQFTPKDPTTASQGR